MLVLVSRRLGGVTDVEKAIVDAGARVDAAPLWNAADIHRHGAEAAIFILGAVEPFGGEVLEALPRCQAIVRRGVGIDNVDVDTASRLGIVVANVPDASVEEVSDHALTLLLNLERQTSRIDRAVHDGVWIREAQAIQAMRTGVRRFSELTLGVVGLGRIGSALARKAGGIYGRVIAADPAVDAWSAAQRGVALVELDELLATADHVSLHTPLDADTRHLIGADKLRLMRAGAILVNCSRGGLVDESALIEAVRGGRLAGAGLDATAHEPLPADDPLLQTDRILLTAHSAAWSTTAEADLVRRSVEAAVDLVKGRRPASVVNPQVFQSPALRMPSLRQGAAHVDVQGGPGV